MSMHQKKEAQETLFLGLFLSIILSLTALLVLQSRAETIAIKFLQEPRCEFLLVVMSYALPFASIHSCICGYYFGLRQTKIPALSQLIEQTIRILSVFACYQFAVHNRIPLTVSIAVVGLVIGEFSSAVFSANALVGSQESILSSIRKKSRKKLLQSSKRLHELLHLSVPLTTNRVLINLLQSVEAISIPSQLKLYNHSTSEALSIYGVLTGMALPLILFPSAITSSVSIMLMPTVAEIQASSQKERMYPLLQKTIGVCFALGIGCGLLFLIFGSWLGNFLFHSETAGNFIVTLAWICPFLYANTALVSVINGLGKTISTFCINTLGLLIRIAGVFLAIPVFGIQGYLWGLLVSQLSISVLCLGKLYIEFK